MEDEFHIDNMIIYIEKEITENFSYDSIIDEFRDVKERRTIFYICVIFFSYRYIKLCIHFYYVVIIIKYINFGSIILTLPTMLVKTVTAQLYLFLFVFR